MALTAGCYVMGVGVLACVCVYVVSEWPSSLDNHVRQNEVTRIKLHTYHIHTHARLD